jgi:hypothetical protein
VSGKLRQQLSRVKGRKKETIRHDGNFNVLFEKKEFFL